MYSCLYDSNFLRALGSSDCILQHSDNDLASLDVVFCGIQYEQ